MIRRFILYLFISFFSCALLPAQQYNPPSNDQEFQRQYEERIKKDRLGGVYIPKNLDDALAQLDKLSSPESKAKFMAIPEDSVCRMMHTRLGQWMIVNWSFYDGSRMSHYLRSAGVSYPDDMADFLILAFHRHLHGKPVEIKELALYFRENRKKEWSKERQDGKVLKEESRQRAKPDEAGSKPAVPAASATPKGVPTDAGKPKGTAEKQ